MIRPDAGKRYGFCGMPPRLTARGRRALRGLLPWALSCGVLLLAPGCLSGLAGIAIGVVVLTEGSDQGSGN